VSTAEDDQDDDGHENAEPTAADEDAGWEQAEEELVAELPAGMGRKLRRDEARSVRHALTHTPKNPYCGSCRQGKMRQYRTKRNAYKRYTARFGHIVTCDHMVSKSIPNQGLRGECNALTVKDLHTKLVMCYPVFTKGADEVEAALRHFRYAKGRRCLLGQRRRAHQGHTPNQSQTPTIDYWGSEEQLHRRTS